MIKPILEVKNITFRYDKRFEQETLSNVSFSAKKGEWVALVGNNGSGKSTMAQLLIGLLTPEKGRIFINGLELNEETKWDVREHIGLVFQNPDNQFIGTTVEDDVAFGLENLNIPYNEMKTRVEQALKMVGMLEYRYQDPSRLSGGQKQRVAIAGILALKPAVLVLDEAFVMLDPLSRRDLLSTLRHLKDTEEITIISITHDMEEASVADRIMVMKSGQMIKSGSPMEVFQSERELEPPFAEKLRRCLLKRGRAVPNEYMNDEELVHWLWK